MRTYRGLLIVGIVLWLIGALVSALGSGGGTGDSIRWLGQLLTVIGVAGLAMVWIMRQVMRRRLRPPGATGDDR